METQQEIFLENRRRTLNDDPQYFGAYLNLARLNIFSINNHLAKEFKLKSVLSEDGLIQSGFICESNKTNFNYNWLFEKLIRLMPVVKQFDAARLPKNEQKLGQTEGKDIKKMAETLKAVFKDIQEFRNDYTHYYSTTNTDKRKLTVSQTTADFINVSFRRAIEYSKSRFENVFTEDDYGIISKKQLILAGNTITTEGLVFLTSIFLDRENAFQFVGKIQGLKGTQIKSFVATREVLMAYCVRLPHDKLISDDPKQALLLDMLNELDRCPWKLYNVLSDEAKKEFRPILSDQAIEKVLANSVSDEERENSLDNLDYQDYIEQLTVRIRHSNRFHYYAMRFIDEQNLLPNFFFQIDLGKYLLREYDKEILGEKVPRTIIENAKSFGKLSSFDSPDTLQEQIDVNGLAKGFEQFAPHYNADINKIGFRFNQETCQIKAMDAQPNGSFSVNLVQPQPIGFLSLHELSKIILLEYLQPGESIRLIRQFCDTANKQLFNIKFIESVKAQLPENWDDFQKQCDTKKVRTYRRSNGGLLILKKRKEELNKKLAPYGLNHKQIPERILNYWLNIRDVDDLRNITERILVMKRDGMKRLRELKKHSVNPGLKIPKVGDMATFIARDIVDMVIDKNKKQKITSIYYDKLQECLAFYADSDKKQQFIGLVRELGLNTSGGHPFLKNLQLENIRKTSEFYKLYLEEKVEKFIMNGYRNDGKPKFKDVSWLTSTFESKEWNEKTKKDHTVFKLPAHRGNIPFTMRQWYEKEQYDLRAWLRNVNEGRNKGDQKRPIDLPTNLFDEKLCDLLAQRLRAAGQTVSGTYKYNELLKQWWQTRDDSTQNFYNGNRSYLIREEPVLFVPGSAPHFEAYYHKPLNRAFNRLSAVREKERERNRKLPPLDRKELEKVFKHALAETEKEIRMLAEEDRILLLMAEQLSPGEGAGHLKLSNIKEELTKTRSVSQSFGFKPNFDNLGNVIAKGQELPPIQLIVNAEMQLKNIKDLSRFTHDRRLPELIAYLPDCKISVDELRYELADYNKARLVVFDAVFKLEKAIISRDAAGLIAQNVNDKGELLQGNIQHSAYLKWLSYNGYITEQEKHYLHAIRNSFSHNQFPHKAIVVCFEKQIPAKCISGAIALSYKQKTETITAKIG